MKDKYFIKDLERMLGVKRKTFFYWERHGKVPRAKREKMSGYRYWTLKDIKELKRLIA